VVPNDWHRAQELAPGTFGHRSRRRGKPIICWCFHASVAWRRTCLLPWR